jgi:hypothetical protein
MSVLNLATVTRVEIKKDLVEAIMAGDVVSAVIRLGILEEMIAEEGFESVDEINEYYQVKRLIKSI